MKVLFLGNSHTYYNDMPQIFKNICIEKGKNVEVAMQAFAGVTYSWHLSQFTELRFALMHGDFDYIVMQQAAHSECPSKDETIRDATRIIEMAKCFGVTPLQTVPWAEKKHPEHQQAMYEIYGELHEKTGVKLNPVGNVFEMITKNHPEVNMYWFDGEHASSYGSYAAALCAYGSIFRESVSDVTSCSFEMYPGTQEEYDRIDKLFEIAKDNPDLKKKALEEYHKSFKMVTDKEMLKVCLDENKAAIIRKAVDNFILVKQNLLFL